MPRAFAILAGKSAYGEKIYTVTDADLDQLDNSERVRLAETLRPEKDGAFGVSFSGVGRGSLTLASVDVTSESVLSALRTGWAQVDAARAKEKAELEAEILRAMSAPDEAWVAYEGHSYYDAADQQRSAPLISETGPRGMYLSAEARKDPRVVARRKDLRARVLPDLLAAFEVQRAAEVARRAEAKTASEAAKAKAEAAEKVERTAWITACGSERLRRCAAEGIECEAIYRDERLALERPSWRWEGKVPGEAGEPRNPPESAFALLDEGRKTASDAVLKRWTIEHEHDGSCYDECEKYDWTGHVAMARFLGRDIVFGGPKDD